MEDRTLQSPEDQLLVMRDIMDGQLETRDGREIGRVADIEAELREDGALTLAHLVMGPQSLAGRVSSPLRRVATVLLRDRFERRIAMEEVDQLGPTLRLRSDAADYPVGKSDQWIVDHILRFIPGSGR